MHDWLEPAGTWNAACDSAAQYAWLSAEGELLVRWPPAPYETAPTDCFRVGDRYWIWQLGVGGIAFARDPAFTAYPAPEVDASWFRYVVQRSWLPAAYQIWGRQVLHASAVLRQASGNVLAFVGPSGAGKSTIAYGLGRRDGWRQVSDDTLAFSWCTSGARRDLVLHPLQNDARLRPATARYYGRDGESPRAVAWPNGSLSLRSIYILSAHEEEDDVRISPLKAADAYLLLLGQAHAFSLKLPEVNQRLMRDYLALTAAVSTFRLTYRRSFDAMESILDAVHQHHRHTPSEHSAPTPA